MCIPALPGRKVSIVYLCTITMNKKPEPEGVEFRILGRSSPLCKEGLHACLRACLRWRLGQNPFAFSLCQIEP